MTDKIEEIRKALEAATPGPWSVEYKRGTTRLETGDGCTMCDETYYPWTPENDADWRLIALAPDMARIVLAAEKMAQAMPRWIVAMADWNAGGEAALIEMETLLDEYRKAVEGEE